MDTTATVTGCVGSLYPEYERAMHELERRVARGEMSLAQLRREVHALRERYTGGRPVALCHAGHAWC